jgi:transposase-like protein
MAIVEESTNTNYFEKTEITTKSLKHNYVMHYLIPSERLKFIEQLLTELLNNSMPKHRCTVPDCYKEYPSLENLYRHMREKHPAYRCRTCGAGYVVFFSCALNKFSCHPRRYTRATRMRKHEAACLVPQSRAASSIANHVDMSTAATTQPTSHPKETIYGNDHVINSVIDGARDIPSLSAPAGRLGYRGSQELLPQPTNAPAEGASYLGIPSYSTSADEMNIPLSLPMSQQFPADHDWVNYDHQIQLAEGSRYSAWSFESFGLSQGRDYRSDHPTPDAASTYTTESQSFNPAYPNSGI